MTARKPITVHPFEHIREELEARGWDTQELAMRMHWDEISKSILALEVYEAMSTDAEAKNCRLGEMREQLDKAFGVTVGFFANLERAWLESQS